MLRMEKDFGHMLSRSNDKKFKLLSTGYGTILIDFIKDSSARFISQYKNLWLYQTLSDSEQEKELKARQVSPCSVDPIYYDSNENPKTCRLHQMYVCGRLTMIFNPAGST